MAGDYHIADIYQGGYSSLNSNYGSLFTGYRAPIENLGISTDPRTANILKEVSDKIAPGQKVVELSLITPETLEAIPKQQLKEVQRLSKLTGVDVTVHGPLVDASGVTQQGFDSHQREIAEKKILNAIERSHEINPNGNIPVTFHTANQLPGAKWRKISDEEQKERGIKGKEEIESFYAVNQETGQFAPIKKEFKFYPTPHHDKDRNMIPLDKGIHHDVHQQIDSINNTEWENSLFQIETYRENAERIMKDVHPIYVQKFLELQKKRMNHEEIDLNKELSPEEYAKIKQIDTANEFLEQARLNINSAFNKAYKYAPEEHPEYKEHLKKLAEEYSKEIGYEKEGVSVNMFNPFAKSEATYKMIKGLRNGIIPEVYKPAEEFAIEKSVETFGNAAFRSYKKFGDKAPIINIENPPAGFGLSRAEDLKNLVKGSREKFVENAMKPSEKGGLGLSKSQAEAQAEKLIGVTWDVGHINQLRQFGFSGKDIIKEAEKVAPYVKHIHLSDNFGMENTELPMGMGNVDFKEVMEKLKEKGVKIEDTKKIVEAAHWWQFQQSNPIGVTLEALGSPIYGMHMGPYWNQVAGMQPGYFGGYGMMLPQVNYETFGAGFSQLPQELGGQRPGGQGGRMSGRGME